MEENLLDGVQHFNRDGQLRTFSSCRILILRSSSEIILRAVFDFLIKIIQYDRSPEYRHAVKLLIDLVIRFPDYFPPSFVVSTLVPLVICGKRSAAEALSALISVAQSCNEALSTVRSALRLDLIFLLATSPSLAVRTQLLRFLAIDSRHGRNSSSGDPRSLAVIRVFFGLTADLYPSARSSALDGLLVLCETESSWMDFSMVQRCHKIAVELLHDDEVFVKLSAVRLMSACAQVLVSTKTGTEKDEFSDEHFLKLCSLARDMDSRVKVEVFLSLEKIKLVSENVLLQSLTKKVKSELSGRACGLPVSSAAGVFLQGLENEFYQVRRAACCSLGRFSSLYINFAREVLDLLMDMLNDEYEIVQLQALETLLQMARDGYLFVDERHMQMFLATLLNVSAPVRLAARKVIRSMQLSNMGIFRMAVNGLLRNLEVHVEDEEDILAALFCVGRCHGEFPLRIMEKYFPEIEALGVGEFKLERARTVAIIVLGISASFSNQGLTLTVPHKIFSYAIPLFRKISVSLKDLINQDVLFSLLCKSGGLPFSEEPQAGGNETELLKALTVSVVNQTLKRVSEAWHAMKAQPGHVIAETMSSCGKELEMVDQSFNEDFEVFLIFLIEYIEALRFLALIWDQLQSKGPHIIRTKKIYVISEKLEVKLRRLRFLFLGLTEKEESHLLELSLFHCFLALSAVQSSEAPPIISEKKFIIGRLEQLSRDGKFEISNFLKESKNISTATPIVDFPYPRIFDQWNLTGRLKLRKAELRARVVDPELPLMFVPGLPVGIPVEVTLKNILKSDRLWLRMDNGKSTQYAFLSVDHFQGTDVDKRLSVALPFYATPKVPFILKTTVCLESSSGFLLPRKNQRGPGRETVDLFREVEIYLADVGYTGLR